MINKYKSMLIGDICRHNKNLQISEIMKMIDDFLKTDEGQKRYTLWSIGELKKKPKEMRTKNIGREAWKIFDEINPIQEQGI